MMADVVTGAGVLNVCAGEDGSVGNVVLAVELSIDGCCSSIENDVIDGVGL